MLTVRVNLHHAWGTSNRDPSSWTRNITGIDENLSGGYSLIGEFIPRPRQGGATTLEVGKLYLDCEVTKQLGPQRPVRYYRLFKVDGLGRPDVIAQTPDVKGWASSLHPHIKQELGPNGMIFLTEEPVHESVQSGNPRLQQFTTEELIAEVRHRLALDALSDLPL